jgi:hypothetical protein
MKYDVIVVGSGASGVAAALPLTKKKTLMLDVGIPAPTSDILPYKSVLEIKRSSPNAEKLLLGDNFESLQNIDGEYISPKLKAPGLRFITQRPNFRQLDDQTSEFSALQSFSKGGLANAWGAGVLRFNDGELKKFPITVSDLDPFYEILTQEIGISGCDDDLNSFFGNAKGLQPPLNLSPVAQKLLKSYGLKRTVFNKKNIYWGQPRLAILTKDSDGRLAHAYHNQEFFQANISSIYNPTYTLRKLQKRENFFYKPGVLIDRFEETKDGVTVFGTEMSTNSHIKFITKKLILAAGSLNTTRIVLKSYGDTTTRVPLLDNPLSFVPLFHLKSIGTAFSPRSFGGAELMVVYNGPLSEEPVQGSFYGLASPLRSDFVLDYPFTIRGNLNCGKYLMPGIFVIILFYPDSPKPENFIRLNENGTLHISYKTEPRHKIEKHIISQMRKIGFWGHHSLCQYPIAGSSIHYAGSFPMVNSPHRKYQSSSDGLLSGTSNVFLADSSVFPTLPAKNYTFTIMANAMRVADKINSAM